MRGLIIAIVAVIVVGCAGSGSRTSEPTVELIGPPATMPTDALSQMEIAFIGNPRQETIQTALDKALKAYRLKPTEANYRMAGDALVALRLGAVDGGCDEDVCSEMAILGLMTRHKLKGVKFREAAALASTLLATGQ